MKKNAIVIAGIMCVAGCATSRGGYHGSTSSYGSHEDLTPPSDPSLSAQYDPALGGFNSTVSESASSTSSNPQLSVNDYHADSSVQGGSNEARGYARRNLPTEGTPHPMDPSVQADSSIRGGSAMARQRERPGQYEPLNENPDGSRIKADSSIRGGSNEARHSDPAFRSSKDDMDNNEDSAIIIITPDSDLADQDSGFQYLQSQRDDFGQGNLNNWLSDKANGSLQGSSNWNPSDDLLPDGSESQYDASRAKMDNDASVGGAASSESGSASSSDARGQSDYSPRDSFTSPRKELNSSANLERDISGEYNIDDQTDSSRSQANNSGSGPSYSTDSAKSDNFDSSLKTPSVGSVSSVPTTISGESAGSAALNNALSSSSVGGPGSSETGVSSSSDEAKSPPSHEIQQNNTGDSENGYWRFRNNRAQGVGSAATGEYGFANSGAALSGTDSGSDLAQRVKGTLTRESTGTFGMMRSDVARNIQVTSHGGTVTLKGTVPTQKDKDMIEIRAREVSGVQKVDNQLTVTPQADSALRDLKAGHDLEDTADQLKDVNSPEQ